MNSNHNVTDRREPLRFTEAPQSDAGTGSLTEAPIRVSSRSLLSGAQEVEIEHHGAVYRLRQTSLGKLILTK